MQLLLHFSYVPDYSKDPLPPAEDDEEEGAAGACCAVRVHTWLQLPDKANALDKAREKLSLFGAKTKKLMKGRTLAFCLRLC